MDSTAEPTKEFSTAACPEFSFGGSPASLENETPVAENDVPLDGIAHSAGDLSDFYVDSFFFSDTLGKNAASSNEPMSIPDQVQLREEHEFQLQEASRLQEWQQNLELLHSDICNEHEKLLDMRTNLLEWEHRLISAQARFQQQGTDTDLQDKIKQIWLQHPPGKVRILEKVEQDDPEIPGKRLKKYVEKESNRRPCANHPNCPKSVTGSSYKQSLGDKFCTTCKYCLQWECYFDFHLRGGSGCQCCIIDFSFCKEASQITSDRETWRKLINNGTEQFQKEREGKRVEMSMRRK